MTHFLSVDELLASLKRHPTILHEIARRVEEGEIWSAGPWITDKAGVSQTIEQAYVRRSVQGPVVAKVTQTTPEEWSWFVYFGGPRIEGIAATRDQAQGMADDKLAHSDWNLVPPVYFPKYAEPWKDVRIQNSTFRQRRDLEGNALASVVLTSPIAGDVGTLYMGTNPDDAIPASSEEDACNVADKILREDGWILR